MHSTILLIIVILKTVIIIIPKQNNSIVFICDHSENRQISKEMIQNVKYMKCATFL